MKRFSPILLVVGLVTVAAVAAAVGSWLLPSVNPGGIWEIACFVIVALILERSGTTLRIQGKGSTSFVITLCAGVLFGGSWAALIVGTAVAISQFSRKQPAIKVVFNTAQMVLSIVAAVALYQFLGGQVPPSYLSLSSGVATAAVQRDFALFLVLAFTYFLCQLGSCQRWRYLYLQRRQFLAEVWSGEYERSDRVRSCS